MTGTNSMYSVGRSFSPAGYRCSRITGNKASVCPSESFLLWLGTVLVAVTFSFAVAVLCWCNGQEEKLASAGISIEQLIGEGR